MLSHPIWQQKGGAYVGNAYIFPSFHRSGYCMLLYLQMARWKKIAAISLTGFSTVQNEKTTRSTSSCGFFVPTWHLYLSLASTL